MLLSLRSFFGVQVHENFSRIVSFDSSSVLDSHYFNHTATDVHDPSWMPKAAMIMLDALADLECTGPIFDKNLRMMAGNLNYFELSQKERRWDIREPSDSLQVMPIGTLIGFGWKGAFAAAGVTIVQKVPRPLDETQHFTTSLVGALAASTA